MIKFIKCVLFAFGLFSSHAAFSASVEFSGKISEIQFYGNGMMLVLGLTLSDPQATTICTGAQSGVVIAGDHTQKNELLSILLTAKTTQSNIAIKNVDVPTTCWAPTFTSNSYINF